MPSMLPDHVDKLPGTKHTLIYALRCVRFGHEWEDPTGWLPNACPKCLKRIEHGDHLSAHIQIISVRFEPGMEPRHTVRDSGPK
jgi:hypothetical protein